MTLIYRDYKTESKLHRFSVEEREKNLKFAIARDRQTSGKITPLQFLFVIRETLDELDAGNVMESDSESENEDDNLIAPSTPICSVCLQPRGVTIMFLPCQHCSVC